MLIRAANLIFQPLNNKPMAISMLIIKNANGFDIKPGSNWYESIMPIKRGIWDAFLNPEIIKRHPNEIRNST
jgi:hypothetical protein